MRCNIENLRVKNLYLLDLLAGFLYLLVLEKTERWEIADPDGFKFLIHYYLVYCVT